MSPFGALAVAGALALIGSGLIVYTVVVWYFVFQGVESVAPVIGALVLTAFTLGAVVADVTFAQHLRAKGADLWYRNTQGLIGLIWFLTFLATLVAVIEN